MILCYSDVQPAASPSQADPVLRKAGTVLDPLIKSAPGMIQALYILARVKFLSGTGVHKKQGSYMFMLILCSLKCVL